MIKSQFEELVRHCQTFGCDESDMTELPGGSFLIQLSGIKVEGWNRSAVKILFVVPPGYPAGQPDCFWVEPNELRLVNGGTPHGTNDSNPIPGDLDPNRSTTWFSWHVQNWDPSRDTLKTFFQVILQRLKPAR